jgi:hypothetical protein
MTKSANGTRIIKGECYYLNGVITANTPEQLADKKAKEKAYRKSKGQKVAFIKVCSIECRVYTSL